MNESENCHRPKLDERIRQGQAAVKKNTGGPVIDQPPVRNSPSAKVQKNPDAYKG